MRHPIRKKGSALALVIMVFSVLMIFSTFTLSFMVTSNKQSIIYQNKTQAYFYARSGAEVVENALVQKLTSLNTNPAQHRAFIDSFDTPKNIDVDLDYLTDPVIVQNEEINGKKILTVTSKVTHKNMTQTVKKGIYSITSMTTSHGFLPGSGKLFIYLGDVAPIEKYNNGRSRTIPSDYVSKVPEDEKLIYKSVELPSLVDFNVFPKQNTFAFFKYNSASSHYYVDSIEYTIDNATKGIYVDGNFKLSNNTVFIGNFDIYVNGSLEIDGTVTFKGSTNLYVRDTVKFGSNTELLGSKSNATNQLKIYAYNSTDEAVSVLNSNYATTSNSGKFIVMADLFIESGNVNLGFPKNAIIDGHVIYNGNKSINIKTNSNSYNDKLISGHIYSPFGSVNLGIHSYQVATVLGGQVIANAINVYPNNDKQGNKFYQNSTMGRIENNPIPIDITESIDTNTIRYESFFIDL